MCLGALWRQLGDFFKSHARGLQIALLQCGHPLLIKGGCFGFRLGRGSRIGCLSYARAGCLKRTEKKERAAWNKPRAATSPSRFHLNDEQCSNLTDNVA